MFENFKKVDNYLSDAPPPNALQQEIIINKNEYYNCSECSSLVEILSISEENNTIEFNCLNKNKNHSKSIMPIDEYLDSMKKYNNNNINKDNCEIHQNNKYICYCFNCKKHLCKECLKTRDHIEHFKNYIIEIQPIKEELDIIQEVINDYKIRIEKIKNEKSLEIKKLNDNLNYNKIKENKIIEEKIQKNERNKLNELKLNNDKYLIDISKIKKKYFEELKKRKNIFLNDKKEINNKYKLLGEKYFICHNYKIQQLNKKFNRELKKFQNYKNVGNMNNIIRLTEIIYNTYISSNDNYYNAININNIILNYFKNDYFKNIIMKKVLNNKGDNILRKILKRDKKANKDMFITPFHGKSELKLESENNDLKINKIIEQYEKQIKHINEENDNQMLKYENKLINIIEEYDNQIKDLREDCKKYIKKLEENKKLKEISNEIIIIYKVNKNDKTIKIFNTEFVNNNKKHCKIIYEGKEYELKEEFNIKNINKNKDILEIKLKGIMNITNMFAMFYGCTSLICLPDFWKWDTSNVTDMSCLFGECSSLISLSDISSWDTSHVNNMHSMFYKCCSLISLPDISNWDISKVTDIHGMFSECTSLIYIPDISKWNTSNIITMSKMFKKCTSLLSLPDISKWNINNVTSMNEMFEGCSKFLNIPKKFK